VLRWCSYCQRFMGESPDYQTLCVTHGICDVCEPRVMEFPEADFKLAATLRDIQHRLHDAGRRYDLAAAERIMKSAAALHINPVDVLIGIIAPLLYQIGEDWRRGVLCVADEHRFTAFCEEVFDRIAKSLKSATPAGIVGAHDPQALLMNAPGNEHTLAIRILTLWLQSQRVSACMIDAAPAQEQLCALITRVRPKWLLISMALAEQCEGVMAISRRLATLPDSIRPRLIVGGYAVKLGMVSAIPGAELMADISLLRDLSPFESAPPPARRS